MNGNKSALKVFEFENSRSIRVIDISGEPWFVAKDICEILEIQNSRDTLAKVIDDEEKGVAKIYTPGGEQEMTIINESGLYTLILRSNKPEAKKFRKWVTAEVLPTIRKTGSYSTIQKPEEIFSDPNTIIRICENWRTDRERMLALEAKVERDEVKVAFYDTVADSKDAIDMQRAAKVLDFEGIGRNNLFEFLREREILMDTNLPYQKYIDSGHFRVIQSHWHKDGEPRIYFKTLIYQKGLDFVRRKLLDAGYKPRKITFLPAASA